MFLQAQGSRLRPDIAQVHAAGALDVDFNSDVAARSRATPGSWDLAAETDPAHCEPPQHITALAKRQVFLNDADSEQAPSAQHHRRRGIPRRKTFSGANNRSSERRCSNEFMATKDSTRRDRARRRDDLAMEVAIDARRETKTATFVGKTTSQRNVHARRRCKRRPDPRSNHDEARSPKRTT